MLNPFREVNWNPGPAERRAFAKSIAIGLPLVAVLLGGIAFLRSGAVPAWTLWLAAAGAAAGALFWLIPGIARPFYLAWYGLACCAGFVISNTAAAAIYYLVITPVGLLLRVFGRDPLERRLERERKSYWKDASKVDDAERYFRQY